MARMTQEHADARARAIQQAAFRVFARKGSERATMQEIAREAGLSAGTLYLYYPGKADLFRAVCDERTEELRSIFDEAGRESASPLDALSRVGQELARGFDDPDFAEGVVFSLESALAAARDPDGLGQTLRETPAAVAGMLTQVIEAAQASGEIDRAIDARGLALALQAFVVGLRQLHVQLQGEVDAVAAFAAVDRLLRARDAR